jgi:hypothetical protein
MSINFCSPPKASKRQEFEEFKEFEKEEPGARIRNPGGLGAIRVWRGAALTRAAIPDGIWPYDVLRLGNVKAGGSRESPSAMFPVRVRGLP